MRLTISAHTKVEEVGTSQSGIRVGNQFFVGTETEITEAISSMIMQMDKQILTTLKSNLTRALNLMNNAENPSVTKTSYQAYLNFERNLFGLSRNEQIPTSLLTIITSDNGQKEFVYNKNIKNTLGTGSSGSIYSGVTPQNDRIKSGYHKLLSSQLLSEHLIKFIKAVQGHKLYNKYYGNRATDKVHGFIADAYMQHIAKNHSNLLKNQVPKETSLGEDFGDIDKLIEDSVNSTRWTSGGDVIIINENGEVVLNVQLKASMSKKSVVGHLSMKELYGRLQQIQNILNSAEHIDVVKSKEMAKVLFDMYKTSAIVQNGISQEVGSIVKRMEKGLYLK